MSDYGAYSQANGVSSFLQNFMAARKSAIAERQQRAALAIARDRQSSQDAQDRALKQAEIQNYGGLATQRKAEMDAAAAKVTKDAADDLYTPGGGASAPIMGDQSGGVPNPNNGGQDMAAVPPDPYASINGAAASAPSNALQDLTPNSSLFGALYSKMMTASNGASPAPGLPPGASDGPYAGLQASGAPNLPPQAVVPGVSPPVGAQSPAPEPLTPIMGDQSNAVPAGSPGPENGGQGSVPATAQPSSPVASGSLQEALGNDALYQGLIQEYNGSRSNKQRAILRDDINAREQALATEYHNNVTSTQSETDAQYKRDQASEAAIAARTPGTARELEYQRQREINPGYRGIDPEAQTGTRTMPVASAMGPFGPGSPQPTKTYPISGNDPNHPEYSSYPMGAADQADLTKKIADATTSTIKNVADAQDLWYKTVSSLPVGTPAQVAVRDAAAAQFAANPALAPYVPKFYGGLTKQDQATIDNTRSEMAARAAHTDYENSRLGHENDLDDASAGRARSDIGGTPTEKGNLDARLSEQKQKNLKDLMTYKSALLQSKPGADGLYDVTTTDAFGQQQVQKVSGADLNNLIGSLQGDNDHIDQQLNAMRSGGGGGGGASDSAKTALSYITQRSGQPAPKGLDCGTGIEKILGLPQGRGAIQSAREKNVIATVQPGQGFNPDPSTVPEGTGVWFGGANPSQRHYGILHYGVDKTPYLAEIHNSGPGTSYQFDTSRKLGDVRGESTHKNYPMVLFNLPQAGTDTGAQSGTAAPYRGKGSQTASASASSRYAGMTPSQMQAEYARQKAAH